MASIGCIDGCKAQNEPGHGGLSTYDLHFMVKIQLVYLSHISSYHRQQGIPRQPWYALAYSHL